MQDWENKRVIIGYDTICKCCGKQFLRQPEWVYKIGMKSQNNWVCSYSCMRKYNKGEC